MRRVLGIFVVVVICAVVIWQFLPGLQHRAVDVYEKYGGWTEEARSADPVGFIDYAERKLRGHLADMQQTTKDLAAARERLRQAEAQARASMENATEMAQSFRTAYRQAEADSSYPVRAEGREYDRTQFIAQVQLTLKEKAGYGQAITQMEQTDERAAQKETDLLAQITRIKAALEMLPAQRAIAEAHELTGETEKTWAEVNDLIGSNEKLLTDSPVRTVDELLRDREARPAAEADEVDVLGFLEGDE